VATHAAASEPGVAGSLDPRPGMTALGPGRSYALGEAVGHAVMPPLARQSFSLDRIMKRQVLKTILFALPKVLDLTARRFQDCGTDSPTMSYGAFFEYGAMTCLRLSDFWATRSAAGSGRSMREMLRCDAQRESRNSSVRAPAGRRAAVLGAVVHASSRFDENVLYLSEFGIGSKGGWLNRRWRRGEPYREGGR